MSVEKYQARCADAAVVADALPGLAAVVGAEQAALVRLDEGVDAPAVRRRDGDADLAPGAFGQSPVLLPGLPSCFQVSPPSREMYRPLPGPPLVSSHGLRRVCHRPANRMLRVGRVEGDVDGAGVGVLEEHLLPGLAAVGRAVDAALRVRAEGVAEHGREGDVGVGRVDDHRADLALLLPDVLPGLAGVGRFVDAVARRRRCRGCWPRRSRRRRRSGRTGRRRSSRSTRSADRRRSVPTCMPPSVDFQTPPAAVAA